MNKTKQQKNNYFVLSWGGQKFSTLFVDINIKRITRFKSIIGNDIEEYVSYIENRNNISALYSEKSYKKIVQDQSTYFLNRKNIKSTLKEYDKIIAKFEIYLNKIQKINEWGKISNTKLLSYFREYVELITYSLALFRSTREESEIGPSAVIYDILKKHLPAEEVENAYQIITESPNPNLVTKERKAWFNIINRPWNNLSALNYAKQFPVNVQNMYDQNEILNMLKLRYSRDLKLRQEIDREIKEKEEHRKLLIKKQKHVYLTCKNNEKLLLYSLMLQNFGIYRLKLKHYWAGSEYLALPLFKEIIRKIDISYKDFFDFYLVDDVINFLQKGIKIDKKELKKRALCLFMRINKDGLTIISGKKALQEAKKIKQKEIKGDTLKGTPAYKGKTISIARVLNTTSTYDLLEFEKSFRKGDILVTASTDPSLVLLMRKSGAILTAQGGITSHAAIVSREYKIPCIVGMKSVMQFIKDGDLVEVDAEKGIIKILK